MKLMLFIGLLALTVTMAAAAGPISMPKARAGGDPPGKPLVQAKCTKCHTLDRVAAKVGRVDKAFWPRTVGRMKINGAAVNAEQIRQIADYLAGLKAGAKP